MKKKSPGFTLIELLVVLTMIGIIASFLFANVNEGSAQSRDVKRQADLRNLESAIELYKNRHGEYPLGCNPAGTWSGQIGTDYACPGGSAEYIVGLAPEFIRTLPVDPKLNGSNSGYAYLVNAEQTVYKLVVARTVEELEVIDLADNVDRYNDDLISFRICDANNFVPSDEFVLCSGSSGIDTDYSGAFIDYDASGSSCDHGSVDAQTSYAVWGGFAEGANVNRRRQNTELIICTMP